MTRLYLRFYFALLGSLLVFAVTTALVWHRSGGPAEHAGNKLGALIQAALAPADAPVEQQQLALQRLAAALESDLTLVASDRRRIASVGEPLPLPGADWQRNDWLRPWRPDAVARIRLPDGRGLIARVPVAVGHPARKLLQTLLVLALAVGVGAYPIVRRLTQRLERLRTGVESLGGGDLAVRVAVEGKDEVAGLAASFNRAATRIEQLVNAHKALLANASHELRTPLTRIRLAIELMRESADPRRKAALERDIAELDRLIDEILLTSRLDAVTTLEVDEDVELLALAAEECARYDNVELDGEAVQLRGDSRLLRRMLRNLLENAQRHGRPPTRVRLSRTADGVELLVSDAGPPIAAEQCEHLFEPFYRDPRSRDDGGAGLGLALVRQIARRHGGEALCLPAPAPHNGFLVRLPSRGSSTAASLASA